MLSTANLWCIGRYWKELESCAQYEQALLLILVSRLIVIGVWINE